MALKWTREEVRIHTHEVSCIQAKFFNLHTIVQVSVRVCCNWLLWGMLPFSIYNKFVSCCCIKDHAIIINKNITLCQVRYGETEKILMNTRRKLQYGSKIVFALI